MSSYRFSATTITFRGKIVTFPTSRVRKPSPRHAVMRGYLSIGCASVGRGVVSRRASVVSVVVFGPESADWRPVGHNRALSAPSHIGRIGKSRLGVRPPPGRNGSYSGPAHAT